MERLALLQPTLDLAARGAGVAAKGVLLVGMCLYVGWVVSAGAVGIELLWLLVLLGVALAVTIPPHVFVALALLLFGAYSLSAANPLEFGRVQVYSLDVFLAIVLLRAILPRERTRPPAPLDGVARLLFGIWAVVMVIAGLRGVFGGHDLISIIRLETPLIYGVGFYFGLGRIIRERTFDLDKAVRNLLLVALGFVAYMAFARLTNSPFETDETVGRLGPVGTTGGELRRDYGFGSAFILYPVLALAGAAYLLYSPRRTALAAVVACIGMLTTLISLIRGEIFGLFIGLAVIALLRTEVTLKRAVRTRAVVAASFALLIGGLALWTVSPPTARAVVERSLPGLVQQSKTAEATADYRRDAIAAGFEAARREPAGVGLIPAEALMATRFISSGYLAHSGITTMLVYAGWIGLAAAVLALLSLLRASFRLRRPVPWLHPFFVGSIVMLAVYSVAADGLVGQGWVMGLAALIAALRFHGAGASPWVSPVWHPGPSQFRFAGKPPRLRSPASHARDR